jgi:hypothetical protein
MLARMSIRLRLLKLAARRPLVALAVLVAVPVLAIAAGVVRAVDADPAGSPRAVLGRVWFDR